MSERLSELSGSVALELRTRLEESRGRLQASAKIVDGLRKEPVIADGTRGVLEQIVETLNKADELHIVALKQVHTIYGMDAQDQDEERVHASKEKAAKDPASK